MHIFHPTDVYKYFVATEFTDMHSYLPKLKMLLKGPMGRSRGGGGGGRGGEASVQFHLKFLLRRHCPREGHTRSSLVLKCLPDFAFKSLVKFVVISWLLNVSATCKCISGTDLPRQFYVLLH